MWQPIDTAPKDGTKVDLWCDGERLTDCVWREPEYGDIKFRDPAWLAANPDKNSLYAPFLPSPPCWCQYADTEIDSVWCKLDDQELITHWMPVPDAPKD